jgi:hypothetical protein
MKLSLSVLLVLGLTASVAHADEESATSAAKTWLDDAISGAPVYTPTKKAPLDHVFNTDQKKCRKVMTGRATNAKQAKKVAACIAATYKALFFDGQEKNPIEWMGTEALADVVENFGNKKQIKKIKASGKGATIIRATADGSQRSMYLWFAVGPDDLVKAVYMQEIITGGD